MPASSRFCCRKALRGAKVAAPYTLTTSFSADCVPLVANQWQSCQSLSLTFLFLSMHFLSLLVTFMSWALLKRLCLPPIDLRYTTPPPLA